MADSARHELFDEDFLTRLGGLHLIVKRLAASTTPGPVHSGAVGDGLEFADHRAYAPGDDIRFIDWPYYARMEKLLLRLFHKHSESDVAVLLDCSASMAAGGRAEPFDYARHVAAALAYVAMGSGRRVVLLPFASDLGEPMRTGRDRANILPLLDYLAALPPRGKTDMLAAAVSFDHRYRHAGTVFLISDFYDGREQLPDVLARLGNRRRDVVALHTFSPEDRDPAPAGPVQLEHAETASRVNLQITEPLRDSYRRRWQAFREELEFACNSRQATYVAAPGDLPFDQLILQTLRQAGVLG
ncbi:MAG: DUF58 domain-containing protein [Phycisphaerae bacterium]|nr:DUF58 domain-containing protein [Phycisphaerae bacterium]